MYPRIEHRALHAAFDVYLSAEGTATPIVRRARTHFDVSGRRLLDVMGDRDLPGCQREGDVEIPRFSRSVPDLLEAPEVGIDAEGAFLDR